MAKASSGTNSDRCRMITIKLTDKSYRLLLLMLEDGLAQIHSFREAHEEVDYTDGNRSYVAMKGCEAQHKKIVKIEKQYLDLFRRIKRSHEQ